MFVLKVGSIVCLAQLQSLIRVHWCHWCSEMVWLHTLLLAVAVQLPAHTKTEELLIQCYTNELQLWWYTEVEVTVVNGTRFDACTKLAIMPVLDGNKVREGALQIPQDIWAQRRDWPSLLGNNSGENEVGPCCEVFIWSLKVPPVLKLRLMRCLGRGESISSVGKREGGRVHLCFVMTQGRPTTKLGPLATLLQGFILQGRWCVNHLLCKC